MTNDYLHPVSYHLRDFGQYLALDLEAAELGNMTLLGANAVGKTTLANAFYPVLIDGSIATPNFNPARSSDTVSQGINPRNTPRDKRTFNSMLLGWGSAAFAVRTGYTYMVLASSKRQVVLGIGAHRQRDGLKSATWWFVLESQVPVDLICTDAAGHGLDKQAFVEANAAYRDALKVFKRWDEYRSYVAMTVYGFDGGEALGKLANAYRLLASPILTGGSARFAPIPEALRLAQEPIDREQVIGPLAMSQRALNQSLAAQAELANGIKRLEQIRTTLFWGNLNHLNEDDGLLAQHLRLTEQEVAAVEAVRVADLAIHQLETQLEMSGDERDRADDQLQTLLKRLAEQDSLARVRQDLDRQIADWRNRSAMFAQQQRELAEDRATVAEAQAASDQLLTEAEILRQQDLAPVITQLHGQSMAMIELTQVLAQTDNQKLLQALNQYLLAKKQQLKEYQHLEAAIERTSADVALVSEMQAGMDGALDSRLTGRRVAQTKAALQSDNHQIHEAGAAAMSAVVQKLQGRQKKLVEDAADLMTYIKDPARFDQLQALEERLATAMAALKDNANHQEVAAVTLAAAENSLAKLQAQIDPDFDPETADTQIEILQGQRDALAIDQTLDQQVADQRQITRQLAATYSDLQRQLGEQKGIAQSQQASADQYAAALDQVDQRLNQALTTLRQFAEDQTAIADILSTLDFVHHNAARVRAHAFEQTAAEVRGKLTGKEHESPMDTIFAQQQAPELAAALREARTAMAAEVLVVPFDLNEALRLLQASLVGLDQAVAERESGQSLALKTYLNAAAISISQQYQLIPVYNQMLSEGIAEDGIRLRIELSALPGSTEEAVAQARDLLASSRPALMQLVQNRINQLVNNPDLADDEEAFIDEAQRLLDTRLWSEFQIYIYRRHTDVPELVNDAFVQSGGSGAEKAQAMVLPLLLVPKMRLRQASKPDAPHLVMFDEFADKLDPETARVFTQTIDRFGFNFIATMPSGAQAKILADGVQNRAYEVMAPQRRDNKFHPNQVYEVLTWQPQEVADA